jgi:hypothetical protein
MLSQRQRARLPAEIFEAIMAPIDSGQRFALHTVFKVVANAPARKRSELWDHFESQLSRKLQPFVRELRALCEKDGAGA